MVMLISGMSTLGRKARGGRAMAMPPTTMTLSRIIRVVIGRLIDSSGRLTTRTLRPVLRPRPLQLLSRRDRARLDPVGEAGRKGASQGRLRQEAGSGSRARCFRFRGQARRPVAPRHRGAGDRGDERLADRKSVV